MIALKVRDVKGVEQAGEEQREVFVTPYRIFHIRGNARELALKSKIRFISIVRHNGSQCADAGKQLISVPPRYLNSLRQ